MRLALALSAAAVAAVGLATPASATCMPLWDYGVVYSYTCSPPGGPATTYICNRVTHECWSSTSGGGPGGGA